MMMTGHNTVSPLMMRIQCIIGLSEYSTCLQSRLISGNMLVDTAMH
jgi:hypothetical protein